MDKGFVGGLVRVKCCWFGGLLDGSSGYIEGFGVEVSRVNV